MIKTVTILGKKYPAYEYNATDLRYILSDFFKTQRHFSAKEYYDYVIKHHPEYKSFFHPTERQIEKMIIEKLGRGAMDGANSVIYFDNKFGTKIAADYKYPNNMSDIEYHFYMIKKRGFATISGKINIKDKQSAYLEAWQNMHYPPENDMQILHELYYEILELNPELKLYNFDINNRQRLIQFLYGICYRLPIADIMKFVTGRTEQETKEELNNKIKSLEKYGIQRMDFGWITSDETIKRIEQQMATKVLERATEKIKQNDTQPKKQRKFINIFKQR